MCYALIYLAVVFFTASGTFDFKNRKALPTVVVKKDF